jgi:hypothetical protein
VQGGKVMAFWIAITLTATTVIITFIWPQKTFPIRLTLLVLGLASAGFAAYRYFEDQKKQQQTLDYWEVARLNAFALHFIGGDLEDHTELNNIIGTHIHNQNGKVVWDCDPSAIDAYTQAIKFDPKFPFAYFYRASCHHANNSGDSRKDVETAQMLFRITTQIPGHNQNHDEILRMIDRGDLGRPPG